MSQKTSVPSALSVMYRDIPDISVGDIVTVYSDKPEDVCSLEKAAAQSGTISHEILCCISARVPRVYVKGGKTVDIAFYG